MRSIYTIFHHRWKLAVRTGIIVIAILIAKYTIHVLNIEILTLNSLFSALVSATIFIIGFLISATLTDYKESERLPNEVAASIETFVDDGLILFEKNKNQRSIQYLQDTVALCTDVESWFHSQKNVDVVLSRIRAFNAHFLHMEENVPANFIVRLKQEQSLMRKNISRIHVIRTTHFLSAAYVIAEVMTVLLILSLLLLTFDPFIESIFFTGFISFVLCYMLLFIREMDNPFDHGNEHRFIEDVSIQPILDSRARIQELLNQYGEMSAK